jgi:hypothetical protein
VIETGNLLYNVAYKQHQAVSSPTDDISLEILGNYEAVKNLQFNFNVFSVNTRM